VPQVKGKKKAKTEDLPVDYLESQLLYVQELRKDKQFKEAETVLNRLGLKLDGKHTLDQVIVALGAEKERIILLEAKEQYGKAISAWTKLMKHPRLRGLRADVNFRSVLLRIKDENDRKKVAERFQSMYKDVQRLFYDCYYHKTYSIYMYGIKKPKPDFVKLAAGNIRKLETAQNSEGWDFTKRDFQALLKAEPNLAAEYEKMKKPDK
jgi:tetratricopeptide (TPR) repeat protein